jgi:hypothetical protein
MKVEFELEAAPKYEASRVIRIWLARHVTSTGRWP